MSDQRRKNVRKAFSVVENKEMKGRSILLIDDVATTGSTLNECARALKKAGVKEVYCPGAGEDGNGVNLSHRIRLRRGLRRDRENARNAGISVRLPNPTRFFGPRRLRS